MAQRTSGEREQFWRDLIGRQPSSGLSIASFCDQAGVSANSFFVWKRRLRSRARDSQRRRRRDVDGATRRVLQNPAGILRRQVRLFRCGSSPTLCIAKP